METEIKLGDRAQDTVTGLVGIVTGKAEYLGGYTQVLLAPKLANDGEWQEPQWIEIERIRITAS